ncbi:MAG: hypothetical protein LBP26_04075 [Clostridiales bacterium]|nr:hypothetical protein [Clostridiales bacterium]
MKNKERIAKKFGSRKAFVVYLVCVNVTVWTAIASAVIFFIERPYGAERLAEQIALCVLALLLFNVPVFMRERLKFDIPAFLQIVITVFILAHCVLGEIYRFYDSVFLFDKALHLTAGIVIAFLGFSVVYGFGKSETESVKLSPTFVALFSFCFALALLTLWEIFEYAMDSLFGMNMQRWKDGFAKSGVGDAPAVTANSGRGSGLIDTMTDLIVGVIGAAVICVIGGIRIKKNPRDRRFFITKSGADK